MVARRAHAVDEFAVVGEQQHAGGVLVQAPHRLHALHCCFLGAQPQRRGQQGVNAGIGGRLLRTFGACGLVEQQVGLFNIGPVHALDPKAQAHGRELGAGVFADHRRGSRVAAMHLHETLLNQTCADTPGAKALAVKNLLELHGTKYRRANGAPMRPQATQRFRPGWQQCPAQTA